MKTKVLIEEVLRPYGLIGDNELETFSSREYNVNLISIEDKFTESGEFVFGYRHSITATIKNTLHNRFQVAFKLGNLESVHNNIKEFSEVVEVFDIMFGYKSIKSITEQDFKGMDLPTPEICFNGEKIDNVDQLIKHISGENYELDRDTSNSKKGSV